MTRLTASEPTAPAPGFSRHGFVKGLGPGLARVAVALDTAEWTPFEQWCARFGPRVGVLKVGLEAHLAFGPRAIETALRSCPRVFLDLKLHDIPNTVAGAVRAARSLGVSLLSVHAAGGAPMLEAAAGAAEGEVGLLAVTLLTHLDRPALAELGLDGAGAERVVAWARLSSDHDIDGVVCSPREASAVRAALGERRLIVTPGIRPALQPGAQQPASRAQRGARGSCVADDDQRRVATPAAALAAGADLLVIGRPLTRAGDWESALEALERELLSGA